MTVLHTPDVRQPAGRSARPVRIGPAASAVPTSPSRRAARPNRRQRPGGAPLQYRGSGVLVSRASHRRRPITPAATVLLALVAAAITLWLGLVAQAGGVVGPQAEIPGRLAVVQVHTGESLQQVAQRVAPHAPVTDVVARIRELNQLETVALTAGQTLIAPVA
ncbi:MAG: hypothetical protein AB1925_16120 [Actinomycetota bacterium]